MPRDSERSALSLQRNLQIYSISWHICAWLNWCLYCACAIFFFVARYTKCVHVHASLHEQSQLNGHNPACAGSSGDNHGSCRWKSWKAGAAPETCDFWPGRRTCLLNPIWMIQTDHLKPIGMGWNMLKPKVHKVIWSAFWVSVNQPWSGQVVPTSRLYGSLLWYRGAADLTWKIFQPPCFMTEDTIAGWYGMMTSRGNWRFQFRFFVTHSLGLWSVFFWQTLALDIRTIGMAGSTWKARFVLTWPDVSVMSIQ